MLQGLSPAHILTAHFQRPRLCLHRILQLAWCRREGTRPLCVAVVCVRYLLCAPGTRDEQGGSYPGQISRKPGRSPACLHSSRCPRQTTRRWHSTDLGSPSVTLQGSQQRIALVAIRTGILVFSRDVFAEELTLSSGYPVRHRLVEHVRRLAWHRRTAMSALVSSTLLTLPFLQPTGLWICWCRCRSASSEPGRLVLSIRLIRGSPTSPRCRGG